MPTMYVVAGPAGSGKSTAFPSDNLGCDYFNADNYAAMLNGGSYIGIPKSIRPEVGPICERFIKAGTAVLKTLFATYGQRASAISSAHSTRWARQSTFLTSLTIPRWMLSQN